jgi:(p)ppGpp synthase/HD superfamily hydrolase
LPERPESGKPPLSVEWKKDLGISTYPVDIEIYANDRNGLLADILLPIFEPRGGGQ